MSLKNFFDKIGNFFEGIWNAAEKAWNKLDGPVKTALKEGTGLIDLLNSNVDKTPEVVIALIQKQFPAFSLDQVKAVLLKAHQTFRIADDIEDANLETLVENILNYLAGMKSTSSVDWADVSGSLAKLVAIFRAPAGTKVAAIMQFLEYTYQKYFKKRI